MHEMSYNDALAACIDPASYRAEIVAELSEGHHAGQLDALVWGKNGSRPHLQALVTLDDGRKAWLAAYHMDNRRGELPYRGFRDFCPGDRVSIVVAVGPRGGVRTTLVTCSPQMYPL